MEGDEEAWGLAVGKEKAGTHMVIFEVQGYQEIGASLRNLR